MSSITGVTIIIYCIIIGIICIIIGKEDRIPSVSDQQSMFLLIVITFGFSIYTYCSIDSSFFFIIDITLFFMCHSMWLSYPSDFQILSSCWVSSFYFHNRVLEWANLILKNFKSYRLLTLYLWITHLILHER